MVRKKACVIQVFSIKVMVSNRRYSERRAVACAEQSAAPLPKSRSLPAFTIATAAGRNPGAPSRKHDNPRSPEEDMCSSRSLLGGVPRAVTTEPLCWVPDPVASLCATRRQRSPLSAMFAAPKSSSASGSRSTKKCDLPFCNAGFQSSMQNAAEETGTWRLPEPRIIEPMNG